MQSLRARVQNGRLVLDEPTSLPEGEVVELVRMDEVLTSGGDYLDAEDRAKLHESIARGLEDMRGGRTIEAAAVLERLRARGSGR